MKQTDPRLPNKIKRYGCHLMSLCKMTELNVKKEFSADNIILALELCESKGYISENCRIENPDGVLKVFHQLADSNLKILQVGSVTMGETVYWKWVEEEVFDFVIRKYLTMDGNHFCLIEKGKGVTYNPDPNIKTIDVVSDILYQKVL